MIRADVTKDGRGTTTDVPALSPRRGFAAGILPAP